MQKEELNDLKQQLEEQLQEQKEELEDLEIRLDAEVNKLRTELKAVVSVYDPGEKKLVKSGNLSSSA